MCTGIEPVIIIINTLKLVLYEYWTSITVKLVIQCETE